MSNKFILLNKCQHFINNKEMLILIFKNINKSEIIECVMENNYSNTQLTIGNKFLNLDLEKIDNVTYLKNFI